jgi:acetylglutamate kinase
MTRVVKIGGRPQSDPSLPAMIAAAWRAHAGGVVIVHGGGDEVSALQTAFGVTATFVGGRRVTSGRDLDIVRMALSGSANKRLVSALISEGVQALGLSGEDGALISARPVDAERMGFVGAPSTINASLLSTLLAANYLPVISPVSRDQRGEMGTTLNVNGDDAAAAIAAALGARELLLVADVPGVMSDGAVIERLSPELARVLVANGTAAGGMAAKIDAALSALSAGVPRVRISDIAAIADEARGTVLSDIGEL